MIKPALAVGRLTATMSEEQTQSRPAGAESDLVDILADSHSVFRRETAADAAGSTFGIVLSLQRVE